MQFRSFSVIFILFTLFAAGTVPAQIPNGGFESWTDSEPDDWFTTNEPPEFVGLIPFTPAHSGNFAIRGEVLNFLGYPFPPQLLANEGNMSGFPISANYTGISGWYQLHDTAPGNVLYISAIMLYADASDTIAVGAGTCLLGESSSAYQYFSADIYHTPVLPEPNRCQIIVTLADTATGFPAIGAWYVLDELELYTGIGISYDHPENTPGIFTLGANYPNPFNPVTMIPFTLDRAGTVRLQVYDISGKLLTTLIEQWLPAGKHQVPWYAASVAAGVYFCRLSDGRRERTRKMVLIK
jgi:hypothetical protein